MSKTDNQDNNCNIVIKELDENSNEPRLAKEEIDKYFDDINENKILGWESKLYEFKLNFRNFSSVTDADILSEEFNDKKTAKIIRGDIERTKVLESLYMSSFKDYLFQFIIYYINTNTNFLLPMRKKSIPGIFIYHRMIFYFSTEEKKIYYLIKKK